jgi:small-conductance mechanosensitive channel
VAGSAALLVGGLGLQNLFSDFVSGIILLVDSSVKVNDVIEWIGLCRSRNQLNHHCSY